jgi:predicted DNA-binding transcriptional regulator AlpA
MNQLIKTEKLKDRELIAIKDLIETMGVSQNTIYRMCDRMELNKLKYRGKCWFRTEEVISYLNSKGVLNNNECVKI